MKTIVLEALRMLKKDTEGLVKHYSEPGKNARDRKHFSYKLKKINEAIKKWK